MLPRQLLLATVLVALVAALPAGCAAPPADETTPDPATTDPADEPVEAVSLLGEELHAPELPEEFRQRQLELLAGARADLQAAPDDVDALIWVGRRTAYLGRYREAIDVYTAGIAAHPDDARLYRHRGHRFLSTRQLDRAVEDLERAAELVEGAPDEIEPDGLPNERGIPTSTLQSNVFYHLGLAHYLRADFEKARDAYRRCLEVSTTPDNVVATAHWLYMTLRRLGLDDEAAAVLQPIAADMDIIENHDYHRLLLMYKGEVEPAAIEGELWVDHGSLGMATLGYGVGNWRYYEGDRERGSSLFGEVLASDQWAAFGYIAAEAELARVPEPERGVFRFRGRRLTRLRAETGWMSLVGLFPLIEGEHAFGTDPSTDLVFPADDGPAAELASKVFGTLTVTSPRDGSGGRRVHLRAAPDVTVLAGDTPVEEMELVSDAHEDTTYLEVEPYRFFVIERSGRTYLRVLDRSLPGRLPRPDIPHFPVDDSWRVEARFDPYDPPRTIPVPTILDVDQESVSPGALVFERDGVEHRLDAIDSGDDLFIILGDRTNGHETYGGGRYVYTDLADDQGRIVLDLNRAYNPPCVFTDYATCPLPPRQNRLPLRVEAGEKMVEGYVDH